MPSYIKLVENWTIGANTSVPGFSFSWENTPGVGANFGPVLVAADPVSHQPARVELAVFDVAKCRRAPGPDGKTEVFYQFGIRNKSDIVVTFNLELIIFKDLMPGG